jgi:hypothetical protein
MLNFRQFLTANRFPNHKLLRQFTALTYALFGNIFPNNAYCAQIIFEQGGEAYGKRITAPKTF